MAKSAVRREIFDAAAETNRRAVEEQEEFTVSIEARKGTATQEKQKT